MNRRLPNAKPGPRTDSAPDAADLYPCTVDWLDRQALAKLNGIPVDPTPYDVLTDVISGPEHRGALDEARRICGTCPIQTACLSRNAKAGEPWAREVMGINRTPLRPEPSNERHQRAARVKAAKFNEERLQDLHELIATGALLDEVLERMNVGKGALWRWCRRHGHGDIWAALTPVEEDVIPRPARRKKAA